MLGMNKRPCHDHYSHDREEETLTVANVLMLLSRGGGSVDDSTPSPAAATASAAAGRMFECKTCSRTFATFQALGGHRASHKKLRTGPAAEGEEATEGRMRLHGCSVCGLEFSIGQALGGHMRRHRAAAAVTADEKKEGKERKRVMWMDLNLTPMENDLEMRKKLRIGPIGVLIGDWIPVGGFSH